MNKLEHLNLLPNHEWSAHKGGICIHKRANRVYLQGSSSTPQVCITPCVLVASLCVQLI